MNVKIVLFAAGVVLSIILLSLIVVVWFIGLEDQIPVPDRIILVTIDTMRSDHLGCYGYFRDTSPFIDSLANRGILFENCYAPTSETVPSHATILTGLYPINHGALRNIKKMNPEVHTLQEHFNSHGYETAAIVSTNRHFSEKAGNVAKGFGYYNEPDLKRDSDNKWPYRCAEETINEVIEWLGNQEPDSKYFLWIHLFDPHAPYKDAAEDFLPEFSDISKEEKDEAMDFFQEVHSLKFDGRSQWGKDRLLLTLSQYDAEVKYVDSQLSRLSEWLRGNGLDKNTAWIITADHGEGLGNHQYYAHVKYLYREQVHVPLIFYFSSENKSGIRIGRKVELVDIAPTVGQLVGFPFQQKDFLSFGQPLLPLAFNLNSDDYKPYSKQLAFSHRDLMGRKPGEIKPTTPWEAGIAYALRYEHYTYVYRTEGENELFDDAQDPYQVKNIIESKPRIASMLESRLLSLIKLLESNAVDTEDVEDEEILEGLRDLGYLN